MWFCVCVLCDHVHTLSTTPLILQVLSSVLQQASLTCRLITHALWSPSSLQEDRLQRPSGETTSWSALQAQTKPLLEY